MGKHKVHAHTTHQSLSPIDSLCTLLQIKSFLANFTIVVPAKTKLWRDRIVSAFWYYVPFWKCPACETYGQYINKNLPQFLKSVVFRVGNLRLDNSPHIIVVDNLCIQFGFNRFLCGLWWHRIAETSRRYGGCKNEQLFWARVFSAQINCL